MDDSSMIIDNLDVIGVTVMPPKTDTKLIVHADAMLELAN
jgi:hypothetical protein